MIAGAWRILSTRTTRFTSRLREAGRAFAADLMGAGEPRRGKNYLRKDQADGPTGRQSGRVPVWVGLPAASKTRSWWAASGWAPPAAAVGHQGKRPCESRLWQSQNPWPSYIRTFSAVPLRLR